MWLSVLKKLRWYEVAPLGRDLLSVVCIREVRVMEGFSDRE